MAIFKSNAGVYPYAVYDIDSSDIDKQELTKGELNKEIANIRSNFEQINIKQIIHASHINKIKTVKEMTRSHILMHQFHNPVQHIK